MKKSLLLILLLVSISFSTYAQLSTTAVKKATLLKEGTPIVNGQTGEVLRVSKAPVNISTLKIEVLEINPGKTAPINSDSKLVNKTSPKNRNKNQLKGKN